MKAKKNVFKEVCQKISVMEHLSYRDFLASLYSALKSKLSRYSYQRFAVDLGFSETNVIRLVIVGQRRLTPMATERISERLELTGDDKRYFIALVKYTNARNSAQREQLFKDLVALKGHSLPGEIQQNLEYYSEWYHAVIREMTGMKDFSSDLNWIAGRLHNGVLPRQISKSLELLEQLGLVRFDSETKRHVQFGDQVTPDRRVENMAAVRWHQKMIEIGRESITRIHETRREIHGMTICVSDETSEKIKAVLVGACEEIMRLEEKDGGAADHVYQINMQFFPFTK